MFNRLLHALIESKNEAADDVLLDALALGSVAEKQLAMVALTRRKTLRGLSGVIGMYEELPETIQGDILRNVKTFHFALRECGRSDRTELRLAAMKLIAIGRQGKLAYVLSENLHESEERLSKGATEAMVALARWVATTTRRLQRGPVAVGIEGRGDAETPRRGDDGQPENDAASDSSLPASDEAQQSDDYATDSQLYTELQIQRPEIEAAVARALDVHRGKHGQEMVRAALLLCDWPGSKTLGILHTAKHGGQSPMVRRLQQPPESEFVEAFLLGATHGQLRSHFGVAFAHIDAAPVLDALLRRTHWVKDHQLALCMHQVTRGAWWGAGELRHDLERRTPQSAARIGEWIAVSGIPDTVQDERLEDLLRHSAESFDARLGLLRIAARRKKGSSVKLLIAFLSDPDERLVRMAAREILRRKPADYENILLQLMTNAASSVRRVIGRTIGQAGFDQFWQRFDRLDRPTRRQAGRAMVKLLPDAVQRLERRLANGPPEQRIKAMQMAQELGLSEQLAPTLARLCEDINPRLRSKAVSALGHVSSFPAEVLVDRLLHDTDSRVRANAIEVLEQQPQKQLVAVLAERARAANSRERANAIKALHGMRVGAAVGQLQAMIHDNRPEHRISALWALRQTGVWQLLVEVGRLAKEDDNLKVRRYALSVLRGVAELAKAQKVKAAG